MEEFDCPFCRQPMELRTGKYGAFFYCRDHGTIGVEAARGIKRLQANDLAVNTPVFYREDPLLDAIKHKGVEMGHHVDDLGQLVDWFNDNEQSAEDDDDHWMNIRPY